MEHVSLRLIDKVLKIDVVLGITPLHIKSESFCGDCHISKQIKTSHKKIGECYTNRVLELLHMDLMGPMQTKSLEGKNYVFVCVDDYSRYTWVKFIKDKRKTIKVCKKMCLQLQR